MEEQRLRVFQFDIAHFLCKKVAENRVYRRISGI